MWLTPLFTSAFAALQRSPPSQHKLKPESNVDNYFIQIFFVVNRKFIFWLLLKLKLKLVKFIVAIAARRIIACVFS